MNRVEPDKTVFFECDIQQSIYKMMQGYDSVIVNAARLAQTANLFGVPHIATRQINFGPIVESITKQHHAGTKVFEKRTFTMLDH